MDTTDETIKKVLAPIIELFGGADGGAAFIKLRHTLLPEVWETSGPVADEFCLMVTRFSKLCEEVLKHK